MTANYSQAGNRQIAPLISMTQAVQQYGLTRRRLKQLIAMGEVTTIEPTPGRPLIKRSDLEALGAKKESQ